MQDFPEFNEDVLSKLPALQLLINLGYQYLTPDEALQLRGGRPSNVILDGVLVPWLREHNKIQFKDKTVPFSEGNILSAVQSLKDMPYDGLVRTNEKIFDLLCLGKSLQQSIDGDIKSFTLRYVDWENIKSNVYHVTEEFVVERTGSQKTRKPDIVLFVNGIPFCFIECKSPDIKDPERESISQHIRNQKDNEIPKLFLYSQLLVGVWKNGGKYATTGTPAKFWSVWRDKDHNVEEEVSNYYNKALGSELVARIFSSRKYTPPAYLTNETSETRLITGQDCLLYSLCRPERLLELTFRYILFDGGEKKIARYQQYFCVEKIMNRIQNPTVEEQKRGGVVWHTQGSGKSLTMVYLAKSLALSENLNDFKIILVTDRVDLDDQIYRTFHSCGTELEQAKTGKHLADLLLKGKQRIITTIINKFEAVLGSHSVRIENPNIFVLVDEGHRGQYGPQHAKMRKVIPFACYIGFTGTPVMKKYKNTIDQFGGLIDTYTIDQAVEEKAVVPLLYEGRHVVQMVDSDSIDSWFNRITKNLSKEQIADLKHKFATTDQLNKAEQKVMRTAWDISEHFRDHWKGTEFKAQLVTQDKATALLFKKYLDEFNMVLSEVLISGPDEREGEEDLYKENKQEVQRFWNSMMKKYGNEKEYNKQLINAFKFGDQLEIIIVVEKLLTGFDAPRNTILYLTRQLKDHTLLQAIARVNRLYSGKDFGYIIDYRGVLENLDHALDLYNALPEFEKKDLENILTDISEPISTLAQKHSILWDTFKEVDNKNDEEEYEMLLADDVLRSKFYERLTAYAKTLSIAFSSVKFVEKTSIEKIDNYQKDLKYFSKLRVAVRRRYAEIIDFSEYEPKIQKLLDTHVGTGEIEQITPLVNIFDKEAFSNELQNISNISTKADTIAHRTKRAIHDRMEEDPAFYKRFSEMLDEVIKAFREERIRANEYLNRVKEIMNSVINRTGDDIPQKLKKYDVAKAYFGVVRETLNRLINEKENSEKDIAEIAIAIDHIIEKNRIVQWIYNLDVQNRIKNDIEDLLFEFKENKHWEITFEGIDDIMDKCIEIAKVRRP